MTEELTKNIVREKLLESKSLGWQIEPEKSENILINKLLQKASKTGKGGQGYPEFILTNPEYPELAIIVECKKDKKFHESNDGKNISNYAVDGALHYSNALSKEFNVIAIAASGINEKNIKISNFLQLKNNKHEKISSELLNPSDLYELYLSKISKSDFELNSFTKNLNEKLHDEDIKEDKRCLLISGILIALQNKPFKKTYKDHKTTNLLFNSMIAAIVDELDPKPENKDTIKKSFEWMKYHKVLNSDRSFVVNLIDEINDSFNNYIKTHEYFDFVSKFYVEFFRYASNAKSLGIVLTPPHIAELFNDLAETNKNSVVLDNCCGTGSFLVSALRYMIKKSDGDKAKEKNIKEKQIVGIEKEQDMFVLSACNMKIHDDGKSNIFYSSCFEFNKDNVLKNIKPTVGLLNPPFKPPKKQMKKKKEEFEFVLNNLDMISPNGITVALLPMDCVNTQKGEGLILKQELMSKHTLLGVMSLPDELFYDSNTSTVTCCMVVRAHVPHNENFKTYLGYWKDDGFVKRKWGRVDDKNLWSNKKKLWLESYFNKKEIKELSTLVALKPEDEWCAEAYMKTDYEKLNKDDFEKTIKNFLSYKFINDKSY